MFFSEQTEKSEKERDKKFIWLFQKQQIERFSKSARKNLIRAKSEWMSRQIKKHVF